jgi:hypothetical protein
VLALVPDPQTTKGKFIKRKTKISNYKTGQWFMYLLVQISYDFQLEFAGRNVSIFITNLICLFAKIIECII